MLNKNIQNKNIQNKSTRRPLRAPALAALALGLAAAVPAHAAPARQVPKKACAAAPATVILKLAPGGLTPARQNALRKLGAAVTRRFDFIGSVAATVPAHSLARVAALPFVAHVSQDGAVKKCDDFTDGGTGAYAAFAGGALDGDGVAVAIVDSGINVKRGDVQSQVIDSVSFVPGDGAADDVCGHGTHVAGIVAGNGSASAAPGCFRTFYGVARSADLVNVRVLGQNGQGSVSSVLDGIRWVVENKVKDHIGVINLSLGHPVGESYKTDPLCAAVEAAWKAGIVVVCAAGNSGRASALKSPGAANEGWGTAYGSIQSPANDPCVITVGAAKRGLNADGTPDLNRAHDRVASYSSRGPSRLDLVLKPDILAPGNKVISVAASNCVLFHDGRGVNQIPQSYYTKAVQGVDISTRYFHLSGTSMAAPVVAGAAALLLQASPKMTPDTVKARLMVSADKWAAPDAKGNPTGQADPCTYGAGYLNITAALKSKVVATQAALSPALIADGNGNVSIDASSITSASHIIWGTNVKDLHIIWGTSAVSDSGALSASHIIWGTSTVFADHSLWATSASAADLSAIVFAGE